MQHKDIIWINGTFDVLHMGHIKLFQKAHEIACDEFRSFSWKIVVGIDTDERIRETKGKDRPVNNLRNRMDFLNSIKYVDDVFAFNSDQMLNDLIKAHAPKFMVIGDDYKDKPIIGSEHINKIIYIPRYQGLSSSAIINRTHN
jgi:D-beta-D-heptose 7-phosphate kinase/D-beta-D-heptose 1-phosphate adenosyltransferase|tara:strand:+ start:358 stop:786 length:429 start_codon:yes stop_codon:yes gene_type:complete